MTTTYLSLGSNMGDRAQNIARAIAALAARGVCIARQSSSYETEPVGMLAESWFLNCAVEAETDLAPVELMHVLLEIERLLGRNRPIESAGPRESRTIDIDILLFGAEIVRTPKLNIPHPRMAERRFVLVPLTEIAAGVRHPVLNKTVAELLALTPDRSEVRRFQ